MLRFILGELPRLVESYFMHYGLFARSPESVRGRVITRFVVTCRIACGAHHVRRAGNFSRRTYSRELPNSPLGRSGEGMFGVRGMYRNQRRVPFGLSDCIQVDFPSSVVHSGDKPNSPIAHGSSSPEEH